MNIYIVENEDLTNYTISLISTDITAYIFCLQNGSSWQASACKRCSCFGWVTQCQLQECQAPDCADEEVLALTPGQCCPTCAQPRRQCYLTGNLYQVNNMKVIKIY